MKTTAHSNDQLAALAAFETACDSHDLHAFGNGRRARAWRDLAACYETCLSLDLESALTDSEHAKGADAIARRNFE